MRILLAVFMLASATGCTALMLGNGASGGHQVGKDERDASQVTEDAATTATIKSRLAADSVVSAFNINVDTYANRVRLHGTVGSAAARVRAHEIAAGVDGVITVRNELHVSSGR